MTLLKPHSENVKAWLGQQNVWVSLRILSRLLQIFKIDYLNHDHNVTLILTGK